MKYLKGTKKDFLHWGFSLEDCPEFNDIKNDTILLYDSVGYWYEENFTNDPISMDLSRTEENWLEYVDVPEDKIKPVLVVYLYL